MGILTHRLLSYAKSHIYELHAILSATISFLLMFPIKKPIKERNRKKLTEGTGEPAVNNKRLIYKRHNMWILFIAIILELVVHTIVSLISPLVQFSWTTAFLGVAIMLTEYAVYDQWVAKRSKTYE